MSNKDIAPLASPRQRLLTGCAALAPQAQAAAGRSAINEDPYPSTYVRYPGVPTLIRHATVFDGEGGRSTTATVIFADGVDQGGRRAGAREPGRRDR